MRLLLALALCACSSNEHSSPDLAVANACGPGPYVHLRVGVVNYLTSKPVAGATGTADLCPGVPFTTDSSGYWDMQVTKGMPFNPHVEAVGYIPTDTGTSLMTSDIETGAAPLFPLGASFLFPHLTDSTPDLLAITILPVGTMANASDPCTTRDGVTFSVKNHPEAVITYYGGTGAQPSPDPSLTATNPLGAAEVSGLAESASPIELVAEKTGCNISFASYPHLGSYRLQKGVLSLAGAFMPPDAAP